MATLDNQLRLVVPVRTNDDGTPSAWAYHMPIPFEVFQANFRILAATKAKLFAQGLNYAFQVGTQVAALHLRDEARRDAVERLDMVDESTPSEAGVNALFADFRRLTMILAPGAQGWEEMPVEIALRRNLIDAEEWREVEGAIVFFTCSFHLTRKSGRSAAVGAVASVIGGSITSLMPMDWIASLQTSTASEPPTAIKAA